MMPQICGWCGHESLTTIVSATPTCSTCGASKYARIVAYLRLLARIGGVKGPHGHPAHRLP